jgi:hypothetical protein
MNDYNAKQFQRIEAYTRELEQIPLEEFRTSAEARATFMKIIKHYGETYVNDFEWIVQEIGICQDSLYEVKYLNLDPATYNPQYEKFIVAGKAAIERFAKCFPAAMEIVLDGTHKEIDDLDLEHFYKPDAERTLEALQEDLTPRPDPWNTE